MMIRLSNIKSRPFQRSIWSIQRPLSSISDQQPPESHFPHIFSPLTLSNGITLPNRVLMGSMHCGLEGHSIPSALLPFIGEKKSHNLEPLAKYFSERVAGGASLLVTGGIAPNRAGWVSPFAAKLTNKHEMEQHKVVTSTVHSTPNGYDTPSKICLQILHTGRYAYHPFSVAPSAVKSPITPFEPKKMDEKLIQSTIRDYVNCAVLAKEAGYDGVEIMGSEGYLINQFLTIRTNRRCDDWGGKFANRMKFAIRIIEQTREATGKDFIIIFRLSMLDLIPEGLSWDEIKLLAQAVEDAGATIINTGIGWHEARIPTIATSVPRSGFSWVTRKLKRENIVTLPLVATNRMNAPHVLERVLEQGDADLISMARPFLADSDFLLKSREGRVDEINTCIACNQACLDHAFVGKMASCLVNPRACHEVELPRLEHVKVDEKRRVAVIGAGPAGSAFAITAKELGHDVTLFDKAEDIGGQFNIAKKIPGKEEFHETIRYFKTKMKLLGVDLRLGREVHWEDLIKGDFDRFVIATGVTPRIPVIEGIDHPKVLSYIDVLKNNAKVGQNVAIIGAGGIGFDVAEFLLHGDGEDDQLKTADEVSLDHFLEEWGVDKMNEERGGLKKDGPISAKPQRNITLLQRKKGKLGAYLGKTTGWIHRATLKKSNVKMIPGCTYEKIDEDGNLHILLKDKSKQVLDNLDNIVICAGQISQRDLESQLQENGYEDQVFTIGGAYEALELDAKRAIDLGTRLAYKIGEKDMKGGMKIRDEEEMSAEGKLMKVVGKFMKI